MKGKEYPYLETERFDSFHELLMSCYKEKSESAAVRFFQGTELVEISYGRFIEEISSIYLFYRRLGIRGQHIGIVLENRYEYLTLYLATVFDNVIIPLDKELDDESMALYFNQFDTEFVFYSDRTKEKVLRAAEKQPVSLYNVDEVYRKMTESHSGQSTVDFFEETGNTDKDRFAILALTSGTDGKAKGVMLSQYNVLQSIQGGLQNDRMGDPTYSILPMNYTYGMNSVILATFYNKTTVCLNLDPKYFLRELKAFNPCFMGAVPSVIEMLYDTVLRKYGIANGSNPLCSNSIRIVNGGAPLSDSYIEGFAQWGIKILNGYGLTEMAPLVAVNREFNIVPGSSGTVIRQVDVKIAPDGEILVKGPNLMLGYYKDEEATKQCMENGYLKTGDIGRLMGRQLFISGRKKNLLVLENGQKIVPEVIEGKINQLQYVKESLVLVRKVRGKNLIITALICPSDLCPPEEFEVRISEDIRKINTLLPSCMRVECYERVEEGFRKNAAGKIRRNEYF